LVETKQTILYGILQEKWQGVTKISGGAGDGEY
jgi:hypothetical protein